MQIGLGLWLGTRQVGGFSPATLFAAGEPGGWYDPSDLSTMFQDTAGTVPVTATGQTVGLLLDKSQGLVLGPELVTNGTFDTNLNGWTVANLGTGATASWSSSFGGSAALPRIDASNTARIYQNYTTVAGRTYKITFDVNTADGVIIAVGTTNAGSETLVATNVDGNRTATFYIAATGTTFSLSFRGRVNGATAFIDNISVKELAGNHLTQATAASRPQYQIDANGLPFLLFDGTDDWFVSPTITPGIDKAQVFAGVRKLSDATDAVVVESSTGSSAGRIQLLAPWDSGFSRYLLRSAGTTLAGAGTSSTAFNAPITNVLTGIGDIAGDAATLRVNGVQAATSAADQGTGNFLAYPLYVGRRGGTSLPFNGRLYQLLVRFGANLDASTIAATEAFVNSRTGAY